MPELRYLFVYGTLCAGTERSECLAAMSRFAGAGRTREAPFHLNGYPGMTVGTNDEWVRGDVYLLNDAPSAFAVSRRV